MIRYKTLIKYRWNHIWNFSCLRDTISVISLYNTILESPIFRTRRQEHVKIPLGKTNNNPTCCYRGFCFDILTMTGLTFVYFCQLYKSRLFVYKMYFLYKYFYTKEFEYSCKSCYGFGNKFCNKSWPIIIC
jgi:hypothetical protein